MLKCVSTFHCNYIYLWLDFCCSDKSLFLRELDSAVQNHSISWSCGLGIVLSFLQDHHQNTHCNIWARLSVRDSCVSQLRLLQSVLCNKNCNWATLELDSLEILFITHVWSISCHVSCLWNSSLKFLEIKFLMEFLTNLQIIKVRIFVY